MNFSQLELLRVLQATAFNLSKAGDKLNIVQSAASRQIQLLEDELGNPLLHRTGKKIVGFTRLGERVLAQIEAIELAKRNILSIAREYKNHRDGELRIATTHTQAKYFLPGPIRRFRQQFPHIRIYMVQASPHQIVDLLHQHEADIAICTEKLDEDEQLAVVPCYEWHHIAVVPHGHPFAEQAVSLQNLASHPLLTYSPGYTGYSNIAKAFQQAGLQLNAVLSAADSDVIKTYVRQGAGVGIIAGTSYESALDGDLLRVDLSSLIPHSQTKIAYLKPLYLPGFLQHFLQLLQDGNAGATNVKPLRQMRSA
ncbi:LysR substrate-binding domain-containing protein [Methylomonas rhizoryzae]|uniref:LysR substrate-binding domain-containing protein n=1 Tax=Methylomonas rhizoryzae TaxID=2608981 RepID=UPI001231F06A|nr:LysR substrate-binding domain-containing protein [Methylomonas rhizoryzae]